MDNDRYMDFYLKSLPSLLLITVILSCSANAKSPLTIDPPSQKDHPSVHTISPSTTKIYVKDPESKVSQEDPNYPDAPDSTVDSDTSLPKDETYTENPPSDTPALELKLPTPENLIPSAREIYPKATASSMTTIENTPTEEIGDPTPTETSSNPQIIPALKSKCPDFPIPMTISGRSLSDRVSVWTGDKLLSETSEFILNYILTVPVCDESGNSLLGQPFKIMASDGLFILGKISNGARHNINLTMSHIPATIAPTPIPTPEAPSITVTSPSISEIPTDIPSYNRDTWSHWSDDDGDCQNTRHEVLILESLETVTFKDNGSCTVEYGKWIDKYTGTEITEASGLDVDHMIPLQNAHISGGWEWSEAKRKTFANYMAYENHLIAVSASANRSKGSRTPDEWKPELGSYWCQYALDWINIKLEWDLSATITEWTSLKEMLTTCSASINYTEEPQSMPTPTPTPIPPTATPNPSPSVEISSVSCSGQPEIIYIQNTGPNPVDLTGWRIEDEGPNYTMSFPSGFTLPSGSTVQVHSAASGEDTETIIYWTGRYVLNNNNDTAHLFDASGNIVSQMSC